VSTPAPAGPSSDRAQAIIEYTWRPARYYRHGRPGSIKSILLHSTGGSEIGDVATLAGNTDRKVSVHWYVTRAGRVYHFVQDADTAWHAGVVVSSKFANEASLGIEQEHVDGVQDWPDVQVQTVGRLVAYLRQKHGADLVVTSHAAAAAPAGRKVDPVNYPWDKLHAAFQEYSGTHWSASAIAAG
jgi:N-acetylmuramoyl-L-alanine amidase